MLSTAALTLIYMPRFSLVIATVGRTDELARLLQTLAAQECQDFELIIVDQNRDDRLIPILEKWSLNKDSLKPLPAKLKHIRSEPGLSKARNRGLQYCEGAIIAFPDDDCWYFPETLRNVDAWFNAHEEYGVLTLGSRDEVGNKSGNKWHNDDCDLNVINIFRASVSYTLFVKKPKPDLLHFDESLGVGASTKFGAGEDTDFLLRLMRHGIRGRFYAKWHIGHPSKGYIDAKRAANYGRGWGRVLHKHSLPLLCLSFVALDFSRTIVNLVRGNWQNASLLWAHGCGILNAYFSS